MIGAFAFDGLPVRVVFGQGTLSKASQEVERPETADLAVTNAYWNSRSLERGAVRDLIARAWAGDAPVTVSQAA